MLEVIITSFWKLDTLFVEFIIDAFTTLYFNPPRPLASGRVEVWVLLPVYLFPVFLLPVNRPLPYPSPAARLAHLLAVRNSSHPPGDLLGAFKIS